jgi:protein gp37
MGNPRYKDGFNVVCHYDLVELPLKWKKPRMIFVNSMSDIFHEDVSDNFILQLFNVMGQAHWHIFQVLTKRPERLRSICHKLSWAENIWFGVTVESQAYVNRLDWLSQCQANIRFVSFEPLLSEIRDITLDDVDWVIVGGESGPGAREIKKEWVLAIRNLSLESNVPFFFKQWGGVNKKKSGRLLDGVEWLQYPEYRLL